MFCFNYEVLFSKKNINLIIKIFENIVLVILQLYILTSPNVFLSRVVISKK